VRRNVNANLAEYHVPVNADIQEIDVTFVDQPDFNFNPLGVRGIGEIGITGVPGALASGPSRNRPAVRDLPITLDKLVQPAAEAASGSRSATALARGCKTPRIRSLTKGRPGRFMGALAFQGAPLLTSKGAHHGQESCSSPFEHLVRA